MFGNVQLNLSANKGQITKKQTKDAKQWVNYFNDPEISDLDKNLQAQQYIEHLLRDLNLEHLSFLDTIETTKQYFTDQHQTTCNLYKEYLERRKLNHDREYFPQVSHAFEFLYRVAPVKFVDGSWLYSTLHHPHLLSNRDLIYIYLEELGLGHPKANHVCMYQQLLKQYELDVYVDSLEPEYFEQAAIQLAIAYAPEKYLPLVIGFNLGYEQLPLHLLITNYELAELGIDPQYFNVHITIDNAHNGHAQRAINAFEANLARSNCKKSFLKLVKQGFMLNDIGKSSADIIGALNIDKIVLQIFQNKAHIGQFIHNEKCQFNGQSINQWLSQPNQISDFLNILIAKNWIIKNEPAENSRFWNLIHAPEGKMFGVFNATEKQIIKDWIQGSAPPSKLNRRQSENVYFDLSDPIDTQSIDELNNQIAHTVEKRDQLSLLKKYLAPFKHHQPIGLWATQKYTEILFPFQATI